KCLEVTHEGTSKVRDSKKAIYVRQFEAFSMKPGETIVEMHTRFTNIVNPLKNLDKEFTSEELVTKFLRSLTKEWRPKVTAIEEVHNLKTIKFDEVLGSLMAYEVILNHEEESRKQKKSIALKAVDDEEDINSEEFRQSHDGRLDIQFVEWFCWQFSNLKENKDPC
ncbi:hypothetical protein, partial [Ralstonia pseudosolanacearum]|uniref:hypothetical protein n=1 Tax=Ralstonia pseudosolanacearum TaxID=1310165 RepID=UPI003CEFC0DC